MESIYPTLTLYQSQEPGVEPADLENELLTTQESVFLQWGFLTPLPRVELDSSLPPRTFQLGIGDRRLDSFTRLEDNELWTSASIRMLREHFPDPQQAENPEGSDLLREGILMRVSANPLTGDPAAILTIAPDMKDIDPAGMLTEAGFIVLDPVNFIMGTIGGGFIQLIPELMTEFVVEAYLRAIESNHPNLVEAAKQTLGLQRITTALVDRLSIAESILDLPTVLEQILEEQAITGSQEG